MSAAQSVRVRFPFQSTSAQPADQSTVLDGALERQLYAETVSALQGCEFDEAVVAVYSYRPERELPQATDIRRRRK